MWNWPEIQVAIQKAIGLDKEHNMFKARDQFTINDVSYVHVLAKIFTFSPGVFLALLSPEV